MIWKLISFIFLIMLILNEQLYSQEIDSPLEKGQEMELNLLSIISQIKEGHDLLKNSDFKEALKRFEALERFRDINSFLGDYILYWQADASMAISHEMALEKFQRIIKEYPSSSLVKKAKMKIIEIKLLSDRDNALKMLEDYVSEFPQDEYAEYLLAFIYKEHGKDAESILRRIYLRSGRFSELVRNEIKIETLPPHEILEKARNLIKQRRYSEAEVLLRKIVDVQDTLLREEVYNSLGIIMFSEKRYEEASTYFSLSGDYYMEALSRLRAGDNISTGKLIEKLMRSRDRRIIPLAIAYARVLRDNGEVRKAMDYLRELLRNFPFYEEKIRWAMAWNYYMTGNFRDSVRELEVLTTKYKSNQYLYWLTRARERAGYITEKEGIKIYRQISEEDRNFYGFLATMRLSGGIDELDGGILSIPVSYSEALSQSDMKDKDSIFIRFKILSDTGFKDEMVSESRLLLKKCTGEKVIPVSYVSSNIDCGEFSIKLARLYLDSGSYSRLFDIIPYLPQDERFAMFSYPLAYMNDVMEASGLTRIDPILIISIMREESRFNPEAVSSQGAVGLMQLMPRTAQTLLAGYRAMGGERVRGQESGISNINLSNGLVKSILTLPEINIRLGTLYLRNLMEKYKNIFYSIAAYNAGEGQVDRWLSGNNYSHIDEFIEDIPYTETLNYVKRVTGVYHMYNRLYRKGLFEVKKEGVY